MAGSHADSPPPVRDLRAGRAGTADAQPGLLTHPRMRPLLLDGLTALGSLVRTVTGLNPAR